MNKLTYSEPYIQFIEQLLDSMKKGRLLCPKFQRPFVWKINQQINLLESIRDGIPVGSIMVWQTDKNDISYYRDISGYVFYEDPTQDQLLAPKKYILDGLQRLTTLYVALNKKSINSSNQENQASFYYDLKRKKFVSDNDYKELNNPFLMPMNILLDSMALLKFQRGLFEIIKSEDEIKEILNEIDELSASFRQYKIPVIPIVTEDIRLVTNTFHKINSEGVTVDTQSMIHALTWGNEYDFNDRIKEYCEKYLDKNWGEISIDIIIKIITQNLNLNIYKTKPTVFGKAVLKNTEIIEDSIIALSKAIEFLKNHIGIPNLSLLPYIPQLIIIAHAFYKSNDFITTKSNISLINNWFWYTSYAEIFAGINDNEFNKRISDFIEMIYFNDVVWNSNRIKKPNVIYSEKYNFRSVRSKCSILNLARLQDKNNTEGKSAYELIREYGKDSILNIFNERHIIFNPYDEIKMHRSLSNKCIAAPNDNFYDFRKKYFYENNKKLFIDGFDMNEIVFDDKSLSIDYDDGVFLESEEFFSQRMDYLYEQEKYFMESTALAFFDKIMN